MAENFLEHKWYFKQKGTNEERDDGNIDDLFNNPEAHLEQTIVRESIQNSLDAKQIDKKFVKTSFKLISNIQNSYLEKYLISLNEHLESSEKIENPKKFNENIELLLIEDFNTTGLTGKYKNLDNDNEKNNIFNFWWNFNISSKKGQNNKGGSRGIGRVVNIIASKCRSFLTFSKRNDDNKNILLGLSHLGHHVINNKLHNAYGRFCEYESNEKLIQPLEFEEDEAKDFLKKIQSRRVEDENIQNGTSNIILWPQDYIDHKDIIESVVENYAPVIVKKDLVVLVDDQEINSETIKNYTDYLKPRDANWLKFCEEITSGNLESIIINKSNIRENYDVKKFFSDEQKNNFKKRILNGEILKFQIKCRVLTKLEQDKKEKGTETEFYFYIQKTLGDDIGCCKFLRGNMPVMREGAKWQIKANAYFLAEDNSICSMLVDAEPPNHASWNERAERFEKNYSSEAKKLLRFIKKFPFDFYDTIFGVSDDYDDVTFADAFPIGDLDEQSMVSQDQQESFDENKGDEDIKKKIFDFENNEEEAKNSNDSSDAVIDLDLDDMPNYKIRKLKGGGFKLFANLKKKDIKSFFPRKCKVTIGYSSVGKKRGIDNFSKLDVDLKNDPSIKVENKNISEIDIDKNCIDAKLNDHEFELIIKGLDGENRDAEVRVIDI